MDVEKKLIKARVGLVLSSPFFASIALRLKLKEDRSCETAYTDSVVLGYNPKFINQLTSAEVKGLICHEVMHVAMLHPFRRKGRNHKKWNIACDYAINHIILKSGFTLPKGALFHTKFNGLEAEVIYNMLPEELADAKPMDDIRDYKQKPGDDKPVPMKQQEVNWKINLTQAINVASMQGKMPRELKRMLMEVMEPRLDWKEILNRFVAENARNEYNWSKPNPRYLHAGLIMPSLDNTTIDKLAVIIDTSASINQKQLNLFSSELQSILSSYPGTEVTAIYVDHELEGVEALDSSNLSLNPIGGGMTDYRPGFEYIEQEDMQPSCIIYFTDGWCDLFPDKCEYPTLWISTERTRFNPPFGEVILMQQRE